MSGQCRVIDELVRKHQRIISHRKLALLCRHFAAQHNRLIMTTWFIGRHPGALQWIREQGIAFDRHASHLDIAQSFEAAGAVVFVAELPAFGVGAGDGQAVGGQLVAGGGAQRVGRAQSLPKQAEWASRA